MIGLGNLKDINTNDSVKCLKDKFTLQFSLSMDNQGWPFHIN